MVVVMVVVGFSETDGGRGRWSFLACGEFILDKAQKKVAMLLKGMLILVSVSAF